MTMNKVLNRRLMKISAIKTITKAFIALGLLNVGFSSAGFAQEIDKEVYVVRPYEPVVSDADKINFLPSTDDVEITPPQFKYSITPKKAEQSLVPEPINPARMVAVSLPRIYKSYIKVGLGNYFTPLAEFNISNIHSRDYSYGLYLYHKSSHSNIRLINNDKVPGGYSDSYASLYGKRMYDNAVLSADISLMHNGFNYYGYNTNLFESDSLPEMERDSIRQVGYLAGFDLALSSSYTDSSHLNYNISVGYDYFGDREENREGIFSLKSTFSKNYNGLQAGLDAGFDVFNLRADTDTSSNTIIRINPWIGKNSRDWRFRVGLEATTDVHDIANFYVYPRANLDIIIIKNVLVPFIGIDGKMQARDYHSLFEENNFILPGLKLRNTSHNFIAYAGIKGSISNAVSFRADISYDIIKNMHFFINDTITPLQNHFMTETDDADLVTYHGQLNIKPGPRLTLLFEGNYYSYNMLTLAKPWHKPEYEISLGSVFNASEKLSFDAEAIIIGNRWVKQDLFTEGMLKLDPLVDVNLKVNYHVSKVFTLFFNLYNITDRSNMIWNQYPSQQFNFLGGLSYKL